jgi:DNA polymerase-1
MRDLTPSEVYEYAAEDADVTLKLKRVLEPKLKEVGAERLFYEIEMPLVPVLASMERNGVRIDTDSLAETSKAFTRRMHDIEHQS